jgi:hypothetical protein
VSQARFDGSGIRHGRLAVYVCRRSADLYDLGIESRSMESAASWEIRRYYCSQIHQGDPTT